MADRSPHRQSGRHRLRTVAIVLGLTVLAAVGLGPRTSAQEDGSAHPAIGTSAITAVPHTTTGR
jgi:hypothetical protein